MNSTEIEEGRAWAARALGKPDPGSVPKTKEQARAEWLAAGKPEPETAAIRANPTPVDESGATRITRMIDGRAVTYRADLHRKGTDYPVGGRRTAFDGTQWQRVA